jgi:Glucodextranase, domain N
LGYRITNIDPGGRYAIVKEVITDPHVGCILQHTKLTGDEAFISQLRLYALCAPHLQVGGSNNNGSVMLAGVAMLYGHRLKMLATNLDTVTLAPAAVIFALAGVAILLIVAQQILLILDTFDRRRFITKPELQ